MYGIQKKILPAKVLMLQDDVPRVDKLLLEAYSQMSEPDSIYAAARSPSLAVQLRLAEHEGCWAEALHGRDQQLQYQALHRDSAEAEGNQAATLNIGRGWQQQGLFNALQQLGCQHVLQKLFLPDIQIPGIKPSFWDRMPALPQSASLPS